MFNKPTPDEIKNWVCVHETTMEHDAQMVRNYLRDQEIPCEILSKKDSSYLVNFGDLSVIYVYVHADFEEQAKKAMKEWQDGEISLEDDQEETND